MLIETLFRSRYSLIVDRNYKLAEVLLTFGTKILKQHSSEKNRLMMVVNLANAVRLQKRMDDAKVILQKEDWTAIGDDFKLCVAAVRGEVDEVVKIMEALGANGPVKAEDYRSWPVFRGMRTNEKFAQAFQKIFGGMLLQPKKVEIDPPPSQASKSLTLLSEDGLAVQ